jgi:hypothetical protein
LVSINPALDRAFCRILISANAKGPGVHGEDGGPFSSRITVLIGTLPKGTFEASAQTAHTNLPPDFRACNMWLKAFLDLA